MHSTENGEYSVHVWVLKCPWRRNVCWVQNMCGAPMEWMERWKWKEHVWSYNVNMCMMGHAQMSMRLLCSLFLLLAHSEWPLAHRQPMEPASEIECIVRAKAFISGTQRNVICMTLRLFSQIKHANRRVWCTLHTHRNLWCWRLHLSNKQCICMPCIFMHFIVYSQFWMPNRYLSSIHCLHHQLYKRVMKFLWAMAMTRCVKFSA